MKPKDCLLTDEEILEVMRFRYEEPELIEEHLRYEFTMIAKAQLEKCKVWMDW